MFARFWRFLQTPVGELLRFPAIPQPVNIEDPIGGAINDAELLLAFAAQSRRNITPTKVEELTAAVDAIASARETKSRIFPADKAKFWLAYDAFAMDMSPLSAHSIRASMGINTKTFPASLATPTAYNATFALGVFVICLALQGFWVAGKELVERADKIELQKNEIQQKGTQYESAILRINARIEVKAEEKCSIEAGQECFMPEPKKNQRRPTDANHLGVLNAELTLLKTERLEKELLRKEVNDELKKLNDRSRPLETLLEKWHTRAREVCGWPYLKFLCPVDDIGTGSKASIEPLVKTEKLEKDVEARQEKLNSKRDSRRLEDPRSSQDYWSAQRDLLKARDDLSKARGELTRRELDRFQSLVVEVRLIVSNLGTYLIAMAMGVLGALAFVLRTLSQQLKEYTYVPVSASVSIIRVCLGAIAGVFGSMAAPSTDAAFKSLPPLFVPFVFGYGIEILFSLLDKVVRTFTQGDTVPVPTGSRI